MYKVTATSKTKVTTSYIAYVKDITKAINDIKATAKKYLEQFDRLALEYLEIYVFDTEQEIIINVYENNNLIEEKTFSIEKLGE